MKYDQFLKIKIKYMISTHYKIHHQIFQIYTQTHQEVFKNLSLKVYEDIGHRMDTSIMDNNQQVYSKVREQVKKIN